MEPQLTIRPLSNASRDAVAALILPIQQIEFSVPITLADQPDLMDIDTAYFRPGGHFWGAFAGEEMVGTIGLLAPGAPGLPVPAKSPAPPRKAPIGVIRKMFVKPDFRGKQWGAAQRLLETLVAYARKNGMEDIYLGTIDRMKAAHRFYERNNFKRMAKEDLPAEFPLMPVDNVFYHLEMPVSNPTPS
ncbi:GNAT family N-acetyltransferase [Puia sp.]|uniref:GNAT family N-acetyltransferase n=1 Tax=Puia sp. TaxID=2045100 RepID=UPI002F3E9C29